MTKHAGASLRQMLTIPYVVLVVIAATVIGLLSYYAGRDAVDTLSNHLLGETVSRITQAVDKHISGSEAVLETAFPTDVPAPVSVKNDIEALRTRFWLATSIHRDPNNYAYYGDRHGQFIGLYRFSETEAELRLRTDGTSPRSIYRYSRINGKLENPVQEQRVFEPRERPWYKAGQDQSNQTWTAIYIDFKTLELVSTRARRVNNAQGGFEGVVATDLSMELLNVFLKKLPLTPHGVAFIVEPDGNLVAASRGPHLRKGVGEDNRRLNAADSQDPLVVAAYDSVKKLAGKTDFLAGPGTSFFAGPDGDTVQMGFTRLQDTAGLDWVVIVAVPRDDFMHKVSRNVKRTVWLALLACVLIALTGFLVLNLISRDLRQLAHASKSLADGILDSRIPIERNDEIGDLAKSFAQMQDRLLTDRLTGIANREAIVRRIEDRILRHRRNANSHPFAVLFIDLNKFKQINDRYGHEVGDSVLVEIAQRLTDALDEQDLAARYGGDEFLVVVDKVSNRDSANARRDKLKQALSQPLQSLPESDAEELSMTTGASIGMAICPDDGYDIDTLIKCADKDMYYQKQAIKS